MSFLAINCSAEAMVPKLVRIGVALIKAWLHALMQGAQHRFSRQFVYVDLTAAAV